MQIQKMICNLSVWSADILLQSIISEATACCNVNPLKNRFRLCSKVQRVFDTKCISQSRQHNSIQLKIFKSRLKINLESIQEGNVAYFSIGLIFFVLLEGWEEKLAISNVIDEYFYFLWNEFMSDINPQMVCFFPWSLRFKVFRWSIMSTRKISHSSFQGCPGNSWIQPPSLNCRWRWMPEGDHEQPKTSPKPSPWKAIERCYGEIDHRTQLQLRLWKISDFDAAKLNLLLNNWRAS